MPTGSRRLPHSWTGCRMWQLVAAWSTRCTKLLHRPGLIVRTSAWHQLIEAGFKPLLIDRTGAQLTTGGDVELCYALRLAGWCLWYEPSLHLQHFMPAGRMRWQYLRALFRSNGAASIRYIPYL